MTDQSQPVRIQDRYLLLERLATGGSADVWRARDEQLDREVAIKLLHRHLLSDETSRRRPGAEGRVAAASLLAVRPLACGHGEHANHQ